MKTVNVHEAKTNFSSLLSRVEEHSEAIIAAVKLHDLTVVTTDEWFEEYGVTVLI